MKFAILLLAAFGLMSSAQAETGFTATRIFSLGANNVSSADAVVKPGSNRGSADLIVTATLIVSQHCTPENVAVTTVSTRQDGLDLKVGYLNAYNHACGYGSRLKTMQIVVLNQSMSAIKLAGYKTVTLNGKAFPIHN